MNAQYTVIDSRTQEETAPFVTTVFPYRANICVLSDEPGRRWPWHWHNEVEFFYVKTGALSYDLPGKRQRFGEGDIGFVNANVLHLTTALGDSPCHQQEHIFLPRLVGGAPNDIIEERYVTPLLQNPAASLIRIEAGAPSAAGLRAAMDRAFDAFATREAGYELTVRSCMSELWLAILSQAPAYGGAPVDRDAHRIRAMLQYIEAHYPEPIGLEEIAEAAQISAREASRCFKRQLNATVFEYLIDLRIDRARDLLKYGSLPITEIALRCGFSSASYFGKIFREKQRLAPREYRLAARKGDL